MRPQTKLKAMSFLLNKGQKSLAVRWEGRDSIEPYRDRLPFLLDWFLHWSWIGFLTRFGQVMSPRLR